MRQTLFIPACANASFAGNFQVLCQIIIPSAQVPRHGMATSPVPRRSNNPSNRKAWFGQEGIRRTHSLLLLPHFIVVGPVQTNIQSSLRVIRDMILVTFNAFQAPSQCATGLFFFKGSTWTRKLYPHPIELLALFWYIVQTGVSLKGSDLKHRQQRKDAFMPQSVCANLACKATILPDKTVHSILTDKDYCCHGCRETDGNDVIRTKEAIHGYERNIISSRASLHNDTYLWLLRFLHLTS